MEDVRQLVQEEGREARNLVAFHVAVDTPNRVARKPPRTGAPPPRRLAPRSAARLRSASAGRDKRSELRARYWALLFGDLQRAVGEIYNTVEAHENINECQEVILVLENYTRDFKALSEWFRLKWEYDNTPPPQRPQSLAWEIRKTDFVRPESRRTNSVRSSPSVSGKNSPCLSGHNTPSGKNSPNPTGKSSPGSGKISPRIAGHSSTSPKGTIEFFSNKIASKIATKPEAKIGKDTRLSDIKEKDMVVIDGNILVDQKVESEEKGEGGLTSSSEDTSMNSKVSDVVSDIENSLMEQNVSKAYENDEFTVIPTNEALSKEINFLKADNVDLDTALIKGNNKEIYKTQQNITPASNDGINNLKSDNASKINPDIKIPENTCVKIGEPEPATKSSKNENKEVNMQETSNDKEFGKTKIAKTSPINGKDKETATINTPKEQYVKIKNDVEKNKVCKINLLKDTSKHVVEIGKAKEMANVVAKSVIIKNRRNKTVTEDKKAAASTELSNQVKATITKLDIMENEYLAKNLTENTAKNDNLLNGDIENNNNKILQNDKTVGPETDSTMFNNSDTQVKDPKKEDNDSKKTDIKTSEVKTPRPAYSQAAAKPKLVTAKEEVKPTTKTLYRSKTVVEIRPNSAPTRQTRQFVNRNQKSKCSYPFNLTTGRTSLFDTPGTSKVIATKRPLGRPQMAAGDARNQIKPDLKTRPPRPNSLKINEQGDKKEKINQALENLKDHNDYGSSDTVITQIDMNRNESSESLKTLVPEGYDVGNSIEVLNVDADKTDNDGWLTVKSRRLSRESKKSKSHWANRFNQPSATTSLPTLNMMESPKSETNPIEKIDRAKSEQPQNKPEKVVTVTEEKEPKSAINAKDMSMIRQKSDVTGLKTKTSRNKALKKDKNKEEKKDCDLAKNNRLHSSLESLTISLARSQESTEEVFDFDKWKAEFMTTLYTNYLEDDDQTTKDDEILKTADPSEMSEIAEMTSQIEENERRISLALDFQSEVDEIKLCQEEDLLNRQIMELQQVSDNDLDTETDDTETDAEILCEDSNIVPCPTDNMSCRDLASCLEHHYESALEGMSWSERVDMLGALEELVARDPGRAQQLHAKLSQGIKRRGSLQDVLRRLQAKQARAEKQRMQLHTERAKKIHQLLGRVEEVKMAKNQLIEEKRNRMERRLQKAAENRDQHLKDIVRKAHDEEEKLREIAFIKQLEAENRRHEFLEQCRSFTIRLREMRRERFDKLEQKAAREAAVGARRQALEAARKQHVESLLEKRKERDARREELKELKRQERDDAAREKAEGVKSRLSALAAAAELEADALRSRIRDKQDASQQRLESHLQAIREKATGPRQPTTSETQDQTSVAAKEQDEEIVKLEQERKERERQKVLRKKARKLKQKIIVSSRETNLLYTQAMQAFLPPSLGKMQRVVNQLSVLISPLIPDYKPGSTDFDNISKRIKVSDIEEKQEFKYDFEEKMGKKKKKKRSQETQNNNDDHKNNNQIEQECKGAKRKSKNKDDQKQDNDDSKATKNNVQEATQNGNNDTNKQANDQKRDSTCNNAQTDHSKLNGTVGEEIQGATTNKVQKPKNNAQSSKNEGHSKNEAHSSKNGAQSGKNDKNKNKNEDKNAKNKDKNDTQRLSKSNSICSSVSDMSGYVRAITKLDIMTLEKLIGELYRASTAKDCNDNLRPKMKTQDASNMMKLHTVKTLGRLLSILAEREDLLAQISLKCVTMIVVTCSRVMVSGPSSALYFFSSPAAAHVISLLCYQLGKDLKDPKELELAKQLSDLVSVCLDAALCETRLQQYDGDPDAPIVAIRARAHNLISYLCLGGCVSRAEHAGEARERMQTLVTLCADLCQPHKADAGPERASALQSLRVALGTSLMGSRAEFCMLFAVGAELSRSRDFVRAARTAHLLRQLAELDHQLVQDAFGEGGWPLEFRAAVARLLSQHAPNDKEAPNSDALHLSNQRLDLNLSEQMVLDLIVLVGYVVVNNPQLHETICENWGVIKTLCTLPANWLVSETHAPALLPTLAVLAERPDTAKIISSEISTKMLEDFINSEVGQKVKMIQILKTGREKAAKKEKQGKKEKPNPTEQTDNAIDGNKAEANNTEKDSIVGNKKENECNVSDNDSIEEV